MKARAPDETKDMKFALIGIPSLRGGGNVDHQLCRDGQLDEGRKDTRSYLFL